MTERRPIPSIDLIDQQSDWGVTLAEATAKKGPGARLLLLGGYALIGVSAFLVLPILAGALLFPDSDGLLREFAIVAFFVTLGLAFKFRAGKLPRNAVQIDYRANELRLGFQSPDGTFVRERVFGFRQIDSVSADRTAGSPAISLMVAGEKVTISFNQTEIESVEALAAQISAARESALHAPVRSRIQSRIMGIEASFREAKQRIRSRVVTP